MTEIPVVYQDFDDVPAEYRFLESDNLIASFAEHDKDQMLDNLKELDLDLEEIDFQDFGLIDFELNKIPEVKNTNEEIDTDNFGNDLKHQCPKCGIEFSVLQYNQQGG